MTHLGQSGGMEHRWKVYIVQHWPQFHEDWTTVTAESVTEAKEKVAESIARRTGEWHLDAQRDPEMIL